MCFSYVPTKHIFPFINFSDLPVSNFTGAVFDLLAGRITFHQAACSRLVQRWATSGSLDREALETMWGEDAAGVKQVAGFKVGKYNFGVFGG